MKLDIILKNDNFLFLDNNTIFLSKDGTWVQVIPENLPVVKKNLLRHIRSEFGYYDSIEAFKESLIVADYTANMIEHSDE